jgi:hypothetical protein
MAVMGSSARAVEQVETWRPPWPKVAMTSQEEPRVGLATTLSAAQPSTATEEARLPIMFFAAQPSTITMGSNLSEMSSQVQATRAFLARLKAQGGDETVLTLHSACRLQ